MNLIRQILRQIYNQNQKLFTFVFLIFGISAGAGLIYFSISDRIDFNFSKASITTTPSVSAPACSDTPYTATISWSGTPNSTYGFFVDVSPTSMTPGSNPPAYWNKQLPNPGTAGSYSLTALTGFGNYFGDPMPSGNIELKPDTTYYTRVWNGAHSQQQSFMVPKCTSGSGPFKTKFGMFYLTWHCQFSENSSGLPATAPVYDNTEILSGKYPWGPVGSYHWSGEPKDGYYCLSRDDNILKKHAELLRDAGIDFIFTDSTNHAHYNAGPWPKEMITDPFNKMLEVWSQVPNAPKIVPLVPLPVGGNMAEYLMSRLDAYPNMEFMHEEKPLLLISDTPWYTKDANKIQELSAKYTIRRMAIPLGWGDQWRFSEQCQPGFKQTGGNTICNQYSTAEQISISFAYHNYLMSDKRTAVPKFNGKTFVQQFETLFNNPDIKIATINAWNEWIAIRLCFDASGRHGGDNCVNDNLPDGSKIFVDSYDSEYSRDIEPAQNQNGDYYYRLMRECIRLFKLGQKCSTSSTPSPNPNQMSQGVIDGVSPGGVASGWAYDPDHKTEEMDIAYYFDGPAISGTYGGRISTTELRQDINNIFGLTGNHGFSITIPDQYRNGVEHKIYVYGIDREDPAGNFDVSLDKTPFKFTLNQASRQRTIVVDNLEGSISKQISGKLQILSQANALLKEYNISTDSQGQTTIDLDIPPQITKFKLLIPKYLAKVVANVDLSQATGTVNFNNFKVGDLNQDNTVNSVDFSKLNASWFQSDDASDLNNDGIINAIDFSYMNRNWFTQGD